MYKLTCKLCGEFLAHTNSRENDDAHSKLISERHLNFKNAWTDNRCPNKDNQVLSGINYELSEYTKEEKDQQRHQEYMMGANL